MTRFLYEKSLSYRGYLLIPFVLNQISGETIYSYSLLSEQGHHNDLHQQKNPAGLCSVRLSGILNIAQQHLDSVGATPTEIDYFQERYTYQYHLIILHQAEGKCFYDHYAPQTLKNIAAPKLFSSPPECLSWVQQGLERDRLSHSEENLSRFLK